MNTPNKQEMTVMEIMDQHYKDPANIVVLAGAGISMDPPSSLPSALELMRIIIDELAPTPEINKKLFDACQSHGPRSKGSNNYLRMERLFNLVYPAATTPNAILELKRNRAPNMCHYALAWLLGRGAIVMTTNFDCLIEKACDNMKIKYSVLVSDKDYERYLKNYGALKGALIIKLHGSADSPKTIQTTLEKIGVGKNGWGDKQPKGKVFGNILQERNLLIVGYSGSDDFDVVPAIIRTRSSRSLLWVSHDNSRDFGSAVVTTLDSMNEDSKIKDIFTRLTTPTMNGNTFRERSTLWEVKTFARELLAELGKIDKGMVSGKPGRTKVREVLRKDCQTRYKLAGQKWHDAAILFDELWDIDEAIHCAQEGGKEPATGSRVSGGMFDAILGRLFFEKGDTKRALEHLDRAQEAAQKLGDQSTLSIVLSKKAFIYNQHGKLKEAVRYLEQAIEIDRKLKNKNWLANDMDALAVTVSVFDRTRSSDYFDQVLAIARETGDMRLELTTLNNMFIRMGLEATDRRLVDSLEQAEELAIALGDLRGMVEVRGNQGSLLAAQGDWDQALALMTGAEELAEAIGFREGIARWKSAAADIHRKRGNLTRARRDLLEALAIWKDLNVLVEIGTACGRLGLIYSELGEYRDALYYLEEALKADASAGWAQGVVDDLGNLGILYQSLGEREKAFHFFSKAVEEARLQGYDAALARNLGNLGMELSQMGEYQRAIQYGLEALDINQRIGNLEGEAYTRCNLASDYINVGIITQAVHEWEQALMLAQQMGNASLAGDISGILSRIRG